MVDSIFMPSARAFGGISDRNSRAGFERGLKGLKVTRTSVRYLVIIAVAGAGNWCAQNPRAGTCWNGKGNWKLADQEENTVCGDE